MYVQFYKTLKEEYSLYSYLNQEQQMRGAQWRGFQIIRIELGRYTNSLEIKEIALLADLTNSKLNLIFFFLVKMIRLLGARL